MGVKVRTDYPREGVVEDFPKADGWVTDGERTLVVAFERENKESGYTDSVKLAQYNAGAWWSVWTYDPESEVGTDDGNEMEPPL